MLLVTGVAYSVQLIRDFVLLTLELATVGMVVVWIDPRPGSGYLSSITRSRDISVDQTLKYSGQIIKNLNKALLQSTSAALGGSARSGDFL